MTLRSYLIDPPKQASAAYRYGLLLVWIALVAGGIYTQIKFRPAFPADRHGILIIAAMMLLNHLAFQFRYPPAATLTLRILAILGTLFGCYYIFYLSRVLFPLH
jgi:hypothetical protein